VEQLGNHAIVALAMAGLVYGVWAILRGAFKALSRPDNVPNKRP
jgi:hypothetical protein